MKSNKFLNIFVAQIEVSYSMGY